MTKKHFVLLATVLILGIGVADAASAKLGGAKDKNDNSCDYSEAVGMKVADVKKLMPVNRYRIRILKPNMAVTQDYSPNRINIEVDDKDIVTKVSCW